MRLTHVRLLADKVEDCVAFYRDVLGLEVTLNAGDGIYYELDAGAVILALYRRDLMGEMIREPLDAPNAKNEGVVLTFAVDDVDATYADLRNRGATFVTEPQDQPVAFIRTAHLRDPAGHLIEINAPLPSSV